MKPRFWFALLTCTAGTVAVGGAYLHDHILEKAFSDKVTACTSASDARFAETPSAGSSANALLVKQTIELPAGIRVEFPIGMPADEIQRALQVKFPRAELPFFPASVSQDLHDKGAFEAHYSFLGRDGKTYQLSGPAGSTSQDVISIIRTFEASKCQPASIGNVPAATRNKQERALLEAHAQLLADRWNAYAFFTALVLIGIGLAPLLWYFFLARLTELAAAVRGR